MCAAEKNIGDFISYLLSYFRHNFFIGIPNGTHIAGMAKYTIGPRNKIPSKKTITLKADTARLYVVPPRISKPTVNAFFISSPRFFAP